MSYSVFVETCAHTLLSPNVWQTVHVYSCAVYNCSCSWGCLVEQRERHVQGDVPIHVLGVVQLCSGGCANFVAGVVPGSMFCNVEGPTDQSEPRMQTICLKQDLICDSPKYTPEVLPQYFRGLATTLKVVSCQRPV